MTLAVFDVANDQRGDDVLQHVRNHAELAIARLPSQFRGKVQIEKLVRVIANRVQGWEDLLWSVHVSRTLAGAFGASLDNIGKIVGQPREGRDDAAFKVWIAVRILLNRSSGTAPDILRMFVLLVDGTRLELREEFPAAFTLLITGELPDGLSEADALKLLKAAKAAGVRVILQADDAEEDRMLYLVEAPGEDNVARGLDDADAPDPGAGWLSSAVG